MSNIAEAALATRFPNGWRIVNTPVDNYRCGLHAIRLSLEHQYPDLPTPAFEELIAILKRLPEVKANNNFSESDLVAVLQKWATENNHGNFALGYIEGKQPLLIGHHSEDAHILWIHNDDFQGSMVTSKINKHSSAKDAADLANKSNYISHWSGIKAKDAPPAKSPSQAQKDAQSPAAPVQPVATTNALSGTKKAKAGQSKGAIASTAPATASQPSTAPVTRRSGRKRAPSQKQADIERDTAKTQQKKAPAAPTKKPTDKQAAKPAPTQQPLKAATPAAPTTAKPGYVCLEKGCGFVTKLLADFNKHRLADFNKHRRTAHGLKGNLSKKQYEESRAKAAQPASTTSTTADGPAQSKKRKSPPTTTEPQSKKAKTDKTPTAAKTKDTATAGKPTKIILKMSKSNDAQVQSKKRKDAPTADETESQPSNKKARTVKSQTTGRAASPPARKLSPEEQALNSRAKSAKASGTKLKITLAPPKTNAAKSKTPKPAQTGAAKFKKQTVPVVVIPAPAGANSTAAALDPRAARAAARASRAATPKPANKVTKPSPKSKKPAAKSTNPAKANPPKPATTTKRAVKGKNTAKGKKGKVTFATGTSPPPSQSTARRSITAPAAGTLLKSSFQRASVRSRKSRFVADGHAAMMNKQVQQSRLNGAFKSQLPDPNADKEEDELPAGSEQGQSSTPAADDDQQTDAQVDAPANNTTFSQFNWNEKTWTVQAGAPQWDFRNTRKDSGSTASTDSSV
jgi:hypothetical protein